MTDSVVPNPSSSSSSNHPAPLKLRQVFFITGTDTEVGKTVVSCVLLARAKRLGWSAFGVKPITAGCATDTAGKLVSEDAENMHRYSSVDIDPMLRAPIRLPDPISPHLAAAAAGQVLRADRVVGQVRAALSTRADLVIVEGAGGWRVPINARETLADIAKQLQKPVILVIRIRLGCLNHALLTAEAIQHDGLSLAGWVVTILDTDQDADYVSAQIQSLAERLRAPCLGILPFQETLDIEALADLIRLPGEEIAVG
ncbi:dethiobiotin synthase [Aquirhabdus parva]|uniref:dethiobiotin synthase n=1 Tax=Aquirhabdus parva TaxID=2283318 RepID=UPI0013B3AE64|nr:dethiobiotin synthase [Aquirhabdus parva]